jgi:Na+/proline symporter
VLLPAYFSGAIYTSYEVLQKRFGLAVRTVAAVIFLLYRTLGDGIRLHAAALVLAVAFGGKQLEWIFILVLGIAMIVYTEEGGVTATIWTDAIQMLVYLAGAFVCLFAVGTRLPHGVAGALEAARQAGKLQVIDASFDLTQPYTLWAGLIGGMFLTVATHGTDHYLVQRLLVARGRRDASIGLVLSACSSSPSSRCSSCSARCSGPTTTGGPSRAATRCCRPSCPRSCRASSRA